MFVMKILSFHELEELVLDLALYFLFRTIRRCIGDVTTLPRVGLDGFTGDTIDVFVWLISTAKPTPLVSFVRNFAA